MTVFTKNITVFVKYLKSLRIYMVETVIKQDQVIILLQLINVPFLVHHKAYNIVESNNG